MTVEEHLACADDMAMVQHHLWRLYDRVRKHYLIKSKLINTLLKFVPFSPNYFGIVKSKLDDEWHRIINVDTFGKYGHIYYNLDHRYDRILFNSGRCPRCGGKYIGIGNDDYQCCDCRVKFGFCLLPDERERNSGFKVYGEDP